MPVRLTPDMMTNVAEIDAQHKELFNRLNAVANLGMKSATKEETERTLNFLGDYIREHFADEEVLQRKSGYPKHEWHKREHQSYVNEFNKLKREYAANGPSVTFTMNLNKSIVGWIVNHIRTVDVELGKYINEHK